MITIHPLRIRADYKPPTTLGELVGDSTGYRDRHQAFIGQCGNGPRNTLYIVGFNQIYQASDPYESWSSLDCEVVVQEFVDLVINIKRKPDAKPRTRRSRRYGAS